jgi:POT family proton-dependent oligopeptide transporter
MSVVTAPQAELFGHPTGLFKLFFAEMWERFSYYGMRALLVLYLVKGFLYADNEAYSIYGAYTALVYMTPFFGGMLADRLLGQRKAVIFGGILMALGQALLMIPQKGMFFTGLAFLIAGNGFFKPNISTIVGSLYPPGSRMRDSGFTIFYMGINLGASMSPLLCGYIGETYGWHYGFGLASLGMMIGLAIFVMPTLISQALIGLASVAAALALLYFRPNSPVPIALNAFTAFALVAAAIVSIKALSRGGLPPEAGQPPANARGGAAEKIVYLGTIVLIPLIILLVSGFALLTSDGKPVQLISNETISNLTADAGSLGPTLEIFLAEVSKPAGLVLTMTGLISLLYILTNMLRLERVPRLRLVVAMVLIFFSMLFWAFFEQAGSSVNLFTDRNIDRTFTSQQIELSQVGQTIELQPTQEQVGFTNGTEMFTLDRLDQLRRENQERPDFTIPWMVAADNVGMGLATRNAEIPASTFQAVNAIFILLFGLVFTALWGLLARRNMEPSTPVKFALGLLQLGLGFYALYYGTTQANERGIVGLQWLILGYALHTTGELCLSPVGLSMITKLSPSFLVSTMMGMWFLATAFSQYLAGIISQFTGVGHGGNGSPTAGIIPTMTVNTYGDVFWKIAITAMISGVICLMISPVLKYWMFEDQPES